MKNNNNSDILLIEDNQDEAELTIRAFRKNNVSSVHHLSSGEEALNFIFCQGPYCQRSFTDTPKCILLDLKMPKISGLDVLKKIKSDERTKAIPIVILTSSSESNDIKACYQSGANSYIVKPVDFEGFVKTVAGIGSYWLQVNRPLQK